jgi:hypothetical protein
MYEMGRHPQKNVSFLARFTDSRQVPVLQVTDATMHHFETVGGCTMREISAFDQSHRQTPQGRFPRGANPENTPADDHEIVLLFSQRM